MIGPVDRPILVVDDDPKIVRLVRTYLEREGHRVVEAGDGRSALEAIGRDDPSLVVLDLMLPEIDGLSVIRAARRRTDTPVIVLSARGTTGDRIAGLSVGADDYLPKPFSPAELVLRVQRVLARTSGTGGHATDSRLVSGDVTIDLDRREVRRKGRPIPTSSVEFRLLLTLVEANGRVLSRDQLLDAVYGRDGVEVLDRTIDVHIGRLRDKLGDSATDPEVIATVRGFGYRAVHGRRAATTTRVS
jgi:DNA-binding response OmpR family regulator